MDVLCFVLSHVLGAVSCFLMNFNILQLRHATFIPVKAVYLFHDIDCNIKLDVKKKQKKKTDLHVMFFLSNFDLLEMLLSTCTVSIKAL